MEGDGAVKDFLPKPHRAASFDGALHLHSRSFIAKFDGVSWRDVFQDKSPTSAAILHYTLESAFRSA
jgi:hypothetical protein